MSTDSSLLSADSLLKSSFSKAGLQLTSRFVMSPMTRQKSPGNIPGDDVAQYYRRRAEGGVGLIITEGTYINHPSAHHYPDVPVFYGKALDGWKHVVDEVHSVGGKIVPQLWHTGIERRPGNLPDPAVPGFGPSEIQENGQVVVKSMTKQDIEEVIAGFAEAARNAKQLGFDGLEIHGAHGYLIDDFFWDKTNQRTDEYGGSLENRIRFGVEIVKAVRTAVGPDFPIIFRFSQWKLHDYSARIVQDQEELKYLTLALSTAGVDIFHVSTRRFWEPAFEGSPETLAGLTRKITGKPVITVGNVGLTDESNPSSTTDNAIQHSIAYLSTGFERGDFDLVAVGRALLSEPLWVNKVRESRFSEIRPFDPSALATLVV